MSANGDNMKFSVAAGADLSAAQYKIVAIDGTIAATNATAAGVLQNKPKSGEGASIAFAGHMKAYVGGGSIAAGDHLAVTTSGWLIKNVTSVSGIVGRAVKAASSGSLCEFIGDFSTTRVSYSTGII